MNEKPLVSVVIPCYNSEHFLPETLDSVIKQTYENWECIIVNDGSTDNPKEVVDRYAAKDGRIKYIYQENKGLPGARNTGIKNAAGSLIQFLDADDIIVPEKISKQVETLEKNQDADVAYSEYICFSNDDYDKTWTYSRVELKKYPAIDFALYWEQGLSIPPHCMLYRKRCFEKWGMFDESFVNGKEDWDFLLKLAIGGAKFIHTPGQLARYRVSQNSMVRRDPEKMNRGKKMLFRKYIYEKKIPVKIRCVFLIRYIIDFSAFGRIIRFLTKKV